MPHLNEFARAGYGPMRDHRDGSGDATRLSFRAVQYAAAVAERDSGGRWLFEEDTVGDVNCATVIKPDGDKRPISGWAYAWPMLTSPGAVGAVTTPGSGGGFVTTQGGTQEAMFSSASLAKPGVIGIGKTPVDPQAARTTKKQFGTVGAPGSSAGGGGGLGGNDFSSLGGRTNVPIFIDPHGSNNGFYGRSNVGFGFGGSGSFSVGKTPQDPQAARLGGGAGRGPGAGAAGPQGGAGSAGTAFQRPDVQVKVRPIFGDDFQADGRFQQNTVEMDGSFPDFHKGALGITISGVKERNQDPLYFPTDPRLIAVEYGSKPSAASIVCDLNGDGMVDPLRTARLHSLCRVVKGPGGGVLSFGDNILALNYSHAGRDGVPGYGAMVDQGEGASKPAVLTLSGVNKSTGAIVSSGPFTLHADRPMTPTFGGQVVGLMSWAQASGPITPGASNGDKHQFGVDQDGHPIQSAHISADAYFKMPDDTELDAPLDFRSFEYPHTLHPPYNLGVDLVYDPAKKHPHRGGPKKGMWRWFAYGYVGDGGGKAPTPTTPREPRDPRPPPITPGSPVPPRKPPVVTEPPGPPRNGGVLASPAGMQYRGGLGSPEDAAWYVGRRLPEPPSSDPVDTFAPPSNTTSRPWQREDGADREARTHLQMALPAILGRALSLNSAHGATRGALEWTRTQATSWHASSPTVARMEAFGGQSASGAWAYTQRPGVGRFDGGTGSGGWIILPPETSLEDVGVSFARTSVARSTTYFAAGPGTYFATGLPVTTSGGMKSGYRWGLGGLSGADLAFEHLDSAGTPTTVFKVDSSKVPWLRESGGPTLLALGAIADGSLVTRLAATLVGSTKAALDIAEALDRVTTHVDVTNTNVATALYTKSIVGGTLSTNRTVRLTIDGDVLQNATLTFAVKVTYGATTLYDSGATTVTNSATRHAMRMQFDLFGDGATNAQDLGGWISLGSPSAPTTGTSTIVTAGAVAATVAGAGAAEDSTVAKILTVTITWSGTSVNASFRLKHAVLERL